MFKELAKIANKLDGLGLTKEADVLDRYLAKIAAGTELVQQDMGFKPTGDLSKEDAVAYDIGNEIIQENNNIDELSFKSKFKEMWIAHKDAPTTGYEGQSTGYDTAWTSVADKYATKMWNYFGLKKPSGASTATSASASPTSWTEYINNPKIGPTDGNHIRTLWYLYVDVVGGSKEFPAFVSWWKEKKRTGGFPGGGGKIETGNVLVKDKEEARRNPLYNHSEAVAETPQYHGDSGLLQEKIAPLDPEYARSIGTFDSSVGSPQTARGDVAPSSSREAAPPIPGPTVRPPGYRKDIKNNPNTRNAPSKLYEP